LNDLLRRPLDWSALLALAEEHGVLGLLAALLGTCDGQLVPQEIQQKLQDRLRAQLLFTLSMTAELFRLLEDFAEAGVETLLVKGPVLSMQAFGDPGLRPYVDLDLLVRHSSIQRATELMIAAGYQPDVPMSAIRAGKIPGEYLFTRPDTKLLVELHTERTFRYYPRSLPIEALFERRILVRLDAHDVPALAVEDELVLICIHGAKHFWERLIWIADVAALITRQRNIDWARAALAARDVGAERMLHVGLRLAADVLETPLPVPIAAAVQDDSSAGLLSAQISRWLPFAGYTPPGLLERAGFRLRMRGGIFPGAAYLLRLSLSPTEEDWVEGAEDQRSWLLDALRRPWRLLRKYGGDGKP
jgi:hypothetical protein